MRFSARWARSNASRLLLKIRSGLEKLVRDRNTPQKVVWRARIVMLAGDGTKGRAKIARRAVQERAHGATLAPGDMRRTA